MKPRTSIVRLLVPAAVALAASAGVAYAAIPHSASGEISGCYEKHSGLLRVIDTEAGKRCTTVERAIAWSQTGPRGPRGPSDGFSTKPSGSVSIPGLSTTVATLTVPSGSYLVQAKTYLSNATESSGLAYCNLIGSGPGAIDSAQLGIGREQDVADGSVLLSMQGHAEVTGSRTLELVCSLIDPFTGTGPMAGTASFTRISAVGLDTLTVQP